MEGTRDSESDRTRAAFVLTQRERETERGRMDLLTPWKRCLQCLPVFSPELLLPPSSSAAPAGTTPAAASKLNREASTAENDLQEAEKPSFSDASLAPDHQHQGLPLSDYAKDVGSLDYAHPHVDTNVTANVNMNADHDDVSVVAIQAPPSPDAHAPFGLAPIQGHHRPLQQAHAAIDSHDHDKPPPLPLHPNSDLISHDRCEDLSETSSQSEDDGDDKESALSHTHDAASHSQSIPSHVQGLHIPALSLETRYSIRSSETELPESTLQDVFEDEDVYEDEDAVVLGSWNTPETSQTEPIDGVKTSRMRRRAQLRNQFKDFGNQLKRGGQQLRKESTKHLQKMRTARKKQGQTNGKSGSFFTIPSSPDRV